MKKIAFVCLLFLTGVLYSAPRIKIDGIVYPPYPGVWNTDSLYQSSSTCGGYAGMIISTRPSELSHINVARAGVAGSWFQVFDARTSTDPASNSRVLTSSYSAATSTDWWFKTGTSSGLIVSVERHNSINPCLDIFYFER